MPARPLTPLKMKLNIIHSRCEELKSRVQYLEQEITKSVHIINCIENQNWEALRHDSHKDSRLLSAMERMGEKLSVYFKQEKDQTWIAEGAAKVSTVMSQSSSDLNLLTTHVLLEIVKHIGACCGAIFVVKDSLDKDSALAMSAGYAVTQTRKSEEIESGEGLVGQCFGKGEKIYITQIPKSYMPITSGLGEASPRCVLLLPLRTTDKTVGVLELASFKEMTSVQLLFLEKISENVAGAIQAVKEAEKQEKLLEQSKIMTLALTKREEELRQNIDQMNLLQENQLRKQNELELAYKQIQEKNREIEEIQKRETELIESKLKTNQQITDKVISKLRSKVEELQNKIQMMDTMVSSSLSG